LRFPRGTISLPNVTTENKVEKEEKKKKKGKKKHAVPQLKIYTSILIRLFHFYLAIFNTLSAILTSNFKL
jgi:hypothetical protein